MHSIQPRVLILLFADSVVRLEEKEGASLAVACLRYYCYRRRLRTIIGFRRLITVEAGRREKHIYIPRILLGVWNSYRYL
jgi:hypothetical protein